MGQLWGAFFAILVAAAPFAVAMDPTSQPACVEDTCAGPGTCAEGVACVPRGCEPVVHCRSNLDTGTGTSCAVNETIDGRMCQALVSVELSSKASATAPLLGEVGQPRVVAALAVGQGNVNLYNLPNSWASPAAEADAFVLGQDAGYVSVGAYRSDIATEGAPHLLARQLHGDEHRFEQVVLVAYHDGVLGPQTLSVGVIVLDSLPESCFVRSGTGTVEEFRCPRLSDGLP